MLLSTYCASSACTSCPVQQLLQCQCACLQCQSRCFLGQVMCGCSCPDTLAGLRASGCSTQHLPQPVRSSCRTLRPRSTSAQPQWQHQHQLQFNSQHIPVAGQARTPWLHVPPRVSAQQLLRLHWQQVALHLSGPEAGSAQQCQQQNHQHHLLQQQVTSQIAHAVVGSQP